MAVIKTAQAWGKPPSFFVTGQTTWGERDRTLAIGYQLYLDTLCPECGQPVTVCRDPSNSGWFEVEASTCYASQAVGEHTNEPGYKPQPGQVLYPVLTEKEEGHTGYGAAPEGWEF